MTSAKLALRFAGLALRRPSLLRAALGAAWHFRARDWYRRPPFLPLPPADYLDWRLHTAFGDAGERPDERLLARYLKWTSRMRR